ncbi:hypothetical protein JCM11251_006030 [Rhodosporidiobolus azoricus]
MEEMIGHFRTSPLLVVEKSTEPPAPPKHRVVENASYPKKPRDDDIPSINDGIDPSEYECSFLTLSRVTAFMRRAAQNPTATVGGGDIEKAFHHLPLHPSVRKQLCLSWRGDFYVRLVAPFGVRSTPAVFISVMDTSLRLIKSKFGSSVEIAPHMDDLAIAIYDPSTSLEQVLDFLRELGWQISDEKTQPSSRSTVHVGVEWDLDRQTMSVPEKKKRKYRRKIEEAIDTFGKKAIPEKTWSSLKGSLQHVTSIVPSLRTEMKTIYAFHKAYRNKYATRSIEPRELRTLKTWLAHLAPDRALSSSFASPPNTFPHYLTSDACESGIGIYIRTAETDPFPSRIMTRFYPLLPNWRTRLQEKASMFHAEGWGTELLLEAAIRLGAKDCALTLHTDKERTQTHHTALCAHRRTSRSDQSYQLAYGKGWSSNPLLNVSIQRLNDVCLYFNIHLTLEWIPSEENEADPVSRGVAVPDEVDFAGSLSIPFGSNKLFLNTPISTPSPVPATHKADQPPPPLPQVEPTEDPLHQPFDEDFHAQVQDAFEVVQEAEEGDIPSPEVYEEEEEEATLLVGTEEEGSLNAEFSLQERLEDPEMFAQHEADMDALSGLFDEWKKVTMEPTTKPATTGEGEDFVMLDQDEQDEAFRRMGDGLFTTAKYHDIPGFHLSAPPDIEVEPALPTTGSNVFYDDVPLDATKRLSSAFLRSLPRHKVLFAASPEGFELGKRYSLDVRHAKAYAIYHAVTAKTLDAYAGNVMQFIEFLEEQGREAKDRFPTNMEDVAMWLSTFVGKVQPGTIRRKLDSLMSWHVAHIQPFNPEPKIIKNLLQSAKKAAPAKKEQRPGITIADMNYVLSVLDERKGTDPTAENYLWAMQALILCAFFSMARFGELVMSRNGRNWKDGEYPEDFFDPEVNVNGANVSSEICEESGVEVIRIHIPVTKTQPRDGEDVYVASQKAPGTPYNPIAYLRKHLFFNKPTACDPLFSYYARDGQRQWMTASACVKEVNKILEADGRERIWPHSFRIGGSNFFTVAKVNPDHIRQVGRWSASGTVIDRYMRNQHITALLHLSNIQQDNDPKLRKSLLEFNGVEDAPTPPEEDDDLA